MDEEITIIDTKTRNEKIKDFLATNRKLLVFTFLSIIIILVGFYSFQIYKENQKEQLSDKYNNALILFKNGEKDKSILFLRKVIQGKDSTYSPLALYFLIDNNLIKNQVKINELFDVLIKRFHWRKKSNI